VVENRDVVWPNSFIRLVRLGTMAEYRNQHHRYTYYLDADYLSEFADRVFRKKWHRH